MGIKFNIKKVFDTLELLFLLDSLFAFGFSTIFMEYIFHIILFGGLSIKINGAVYGFFGYARGVR